MFVKQIKPTYRKNTKKHGRIYHGYKAHITTDKNGMIKYFIFDTAKVHDSKHIDQLTQNEKFEIYADSAFMNKERKKDQKKKVFFSRLFRGACAVKKINA